jgi:TM2 domain-containing membrane protein YozV
MPYENTTRYPGAQPFKDDELSRKTFFGRSREVALLTDQIVANRLVVVYARSGVGKSSLLNAGVSERLRSDHFIPLTIRLNVRSDVPVSNIIQGVELSARVQKIEYHPGSNDSLWSFLKTAEFWTGDILLTPVLIFDQFEEVFTLQTSSFRDELLKALGHAIRGTPPANRPHSVSTESAMLSESPPTVRIVFSIREDFLGHLEEASSRIPQILNSRFRLLPLSVSAAEEAIIQPALIQDTTFSSPTFNYSVDATALILDYLAGKSKNIAKAFKTIEPFQLQLICQRVEEIVAEARRTRLSDAAPTVSVQLLGGRVGLSRTVRSFYERQVASLSTWQTRRRVKRLFELYLISPEGRRISLEATEIRRVLRIEEAVLIDLVNKRLLRADQRADVGNYYELSHDTLIAPILANRRRSRLTFGAATFVLGILATPPALLFGMMVVIFIGALIFPDYPWSKEFWAGARSTSKAKGVPESETKVGQVIGVFVLSTVALGSGLFAARMIAKGAEDLRRYSHRQELASRDGHVTRTVAGTLAILLGPFGIHKLYLGYYSQGFVVLLCSLCLVAILWPLHYGYYGVLPTALLGIAEGVIYLRSSDEQFVLQYLERRRSWL